MSAMKKIVAEGRERFLREIAEQLPLDRIEELHLFSSIRQGRTESAIRENGHSARFERSHQPVFLAPLLAGLSSVGHAHRAHIQTS